MKIVKTYLCKKCGKILTTSFSINNCDDIEIAGISMNTSMVCPCCKSHMIECDNAIASSIYRLNLLGFKTYACCEGHFTSELILETVGGDLEYAYDLAYVAIERVSIKGLITILKVMEEFSIDLIPPIVEVEEDAASNTYNVNLRQNFNPIEGDREENNKQFTRTRNDFLSFLDCLSEIEHVEGVSA